MSHQSRASWLWVLLIILGSTVPGTGAERRGRRDRGNSERDMRRLCEELGVGTGATVAEVGCGGANESMVLARIVGPQGTVFAEEIDSGKVAKVLEVTSERELPQVVPVLGGSSDPRFPNGAVDLIFMRRVFHHFAKPRAMLAAMREDLRPGGHLVIVDGQRGVLRDPVPLEEREAHHHWTGETAVVRLAREAGFLFVDVSYDLFSGGDTFTAIFRRPAAGDGPGVDPALPPCWSPEWITSALARTPLEGRRVAVVALDHGRDLVAPLRAAVGEGGRVWDVVLDEWRVSKEETPPVGDGVDVEVVRCEKGRISWPDDARVEGAVFADAYHRVWDPVPLLRSLRERLSEGCRVAVVDRRGPSDEERRLAGHRRRADPRRVIREFEEAGFVFLDDDHPPDDGRFLLWFAVAGDGDR